MKNDFKVIELCKTLPQLLNSTCKLKDLCEKKITIKSIGIVNINYKTTCLISL